MLVPYTPPLDWSGLLDFLQWRQIPGVESVTDDAYSRTVCVNGAAGVLRVSPASGDRLEVTVSDALLPYLPSIVQTVQALFDLDFDPATLQGRFASDPLLGDVARRYPGIRVPGCWDAFELCVRAVIRQQISVAGASTLAGCLAARFGTPINSGSPALTTIFPAAETLAHADISGLGLVSARARTISALASGNLNLTPGSDLDSAVESLTAIPGIGPWTANYIVMRALKHPDAFPAADLILRRAASPNAPYTARQLTAYAERWRPFRAYAALLPWRTMKKIDSTARPG